MMETNQRVLRVLLAVVVLALAACTPRGPAKAAAPVTPAAPKPVPAPVPPPAPLSTPQTRVELPAPQPLDPAALDTDTATPEPPLVKPAPARRPPATVTVTPPPAAQPAEPPRPTIQELIPPVELKRLQDEVQNRRKEAAQILEQFGRRRATREQQLAITNIRNFLTLSDEAEKRNDIRQADALAERAQLLARDLQNGK
jgi:hypothetical protein